MKIRQYLAVLLITMLQLLAGSAQTLPAPTAPPGAAYKLSPGATEVAKLAQSGVDEGVVLSFIGQSHSYYNLAAADIVELKAAGVSSQALSAMLNRDAALRTQSPASPPAAAPPDSPPPTVTQSDAATPPIANPAPANTTVVMQSVPPPPQVEVVPVSPGPDYLWTPGWWSWNGGAWIWFGGYWAYPS